MLSLIVHCQLFVLYIVRVSLIMKPFSVYGEKLDTCYQIPLDKDVGMLSVSPCDICRRSNACAMRAMRALAAKAYVA